MSDGDLIKRWIDAQMKRELSIKDPKDMPSMNERKRYKVILVDDSPINFSMEESFDLDMNRLQLKISERRLEIGEAECVQGENGRMFIDMLLVGNYTVQAEYAPDLTRYKGTIPIKGQSGE